MANNLKKTEQNTEDTSNDTGDEMETINLEAEVGTQMVHTDATDPSVDNRQPAVLLPQSKGIELRTCGKRGHLDQPDDPEPENGPKVTTARRGRTACLQCGIRARRGRKKGYSLSTVPDLRERSPVDEGRFSPTLAPSDSIIESICKEAHAVLDEARKSKNLSGRVHGRINQACREILLGAECLQSREANDEMRVLKADNKRMREQLAQLTAETKALRTAFSERTNQPPMAKPTESLAAAVPDLLAELKEDLKRDLLVSLGEMMNVRIGEVKSLLPPAPILRPPLRGDTAREAGRQQGPSSVQAASAAGAPASKEAATGATLMPPANTGASTAGKSQKKGKQKKKGKVPKQVPQTVLAPPPPTQLPAQPQTESEWTNVVGRKAKRKANKVAAATVQPVAKPPVPKPKKLSAPTTAAIVVALKPGSEATYASIMTKATTIGLAEVGLDHVRVRKTADGARIIEVPGADNSRAADCLREKLEGLIGNDARVYRPIKMAELVVTGLIESTSLEAVAAAVAAKGGIKEEEVKVGNVRLTFNGTGSTLIKCPISAATRVLEGGRLLVGWSSAAVRALDPAPLRCFKCLGTGHTRATCPSQEERGNLCFRCSKPGHKAAECREAPFCAVCHHSKIKAGHVMGGLSCAPPRVRGREPSTRTPGIPNNSGAVSTEGQRMDH